MSPRWTLLILIVFGLVTRAYGQASRTWVSGVGDDSGPCSRTTPCKTFAAALARTAARGEINALDAGGFGTIIIDKSITIDGGAAPSGILFPSATGVTINITDPADPDKRVVLRNLQINGVGTGLTGVGIIAANRVELERVFIHGAGAPAPDGSGVEIAVSSPVTVFLRHCTIAGNAGSGIVSSGTSAPVTLTVADSNIGHNATGIRLEQGTSLALSGSAVSANDGNGLFVGFGCDAHVDSSTLSFNATAVDNRGTARISASEVTYNGVAFRSTPVETHGNNAILNNGSISIGLPRRPVAIGLQ